VRENFANESKNVKQLLVDVMKNASLEFLELANTSVDDF